ncbi:MAG: cystathionine gamma-synthase [Pseudonocardia sp.]|nr:cystathionine gamma-synthase [Pseudonocardia sp.]
MQGFSTRAIHAGQEPDPTTGAVTVPIHPSSTFAQDGVGGTRGGFEYSRSANPTRTALQECLAALEGGRHAHAFGSGMGASDTLLRVLLRPGDHMVIPHDAYGGTFRLVDKVLSGWGVEYTAVDLGDLDALRAALRPSTKVIWCESPTNPLLGIADIAGLAGVAHAASVTHPPRLVVDNTFASPYLQTPLALGADVVLHSTTKYVGGHSDVVGGALVTSDDELAEAISFTQNSVGSVPGPFDAWLTLRGAKTLAVRMERHSDNAERVVELLAAHPGVDRVLYPGLPEHPGHEAAAKQMRRFGGMVSFLAAGGREAALKICATTKLFTLAESLGGVESLIEHPGQMTHASVAGSMLEVPDSLVRLSVGIEDVDDLLDDLRTALDAASA